MVINSHNHSDYSEKMQRFQDYIKALEDERCKIQVFQRELPLCLQLVTQAIEACKQQLSGTSTEYNLNGQSECSEQTSTEGPVLEEFIPMKRSSDNEEQQSKKPKNNTNVKGSINGNEKSSKKSDWLRSVQLWNQTPDPPPKEGSSPRKVSVVEVKKEGSGGAFHPFKREKSVGTSAATTATVQGPMKSAAPVAAASSSADTGGSIDGGSGGSKKEEKEGQSQRKARRCWSSELHKRFIQALQQLGGSHVATPKQIRELMKVDGLTNDEVKSHLQKYRLHTRRPSSSIHNNSHPQAPQIVVVGGIWVPPPEYAAMAGTTTSREAPVAVVATTSNGIYAPIPALPPPFQETLTSPKHNRSNSDDQGSHSEGRVHSRSPVSSSSVHTTSASLSY